MEYFKIRKFKGKNLRTRNCKKTTKKLFVTILQNSSSNVCYRKNYSHSDFQNIIDSELDTDNYEFSTTTAARLESSTQLFSKLAFALPHACNWYKVTWSCHWFQPAGCWSSCFKIWTIGTTFRLAWIQSTRRWQKWSSECWIPVYFWFEELGLYSFDSFLLDKAIFYLFKFNLVFCQEIDKIWAIKIRQELYAHHKKHLDRIILQLWNEQFNRSDYFCFRLFEIRKILQIYHQGQRHHTLAVRFLCRCDINLGASLPLHPSSSHCSEQRVVQSPQKTTPREKQVRTETPRADVFPPFKHE